MEIRAKIIEDVKGRQERLKKINKLKEEQAARMMRKNAPVPLKVLNEVKSLPNNSVVELALPQTTAIQKTPNLISTPPVENDVSNVTFYILTRTNNRPNGYKKIIDTLDAQTYKNYKHLVSLDNPENINYLDKKVSEPVFIDKNEVLKRPDIPNPNTGIRFIYNLYLNDLLDKCGDGWVIILDDDDFFYTKNGLELLTKYCKGDTDLILMPTIYPDGKMLPDYRGLNVAPRLGNISSQCICVRTDLAKSVKFDGWKCGDFRYIDALYKKSKSKVWINTPIIGRGNYGGMGRGIDIKYQPKEKIKIEENEDTIYIVTVGWNCEAYIADYYNSLRNQKNKNWVAYIYDDASSDRSWAALAKLQENDPRLRCYRSNSNRGACYGRVKMLREIDTLNLDNNIISIVDLDDYLPNYSLEKLLDYYKTDSNIKMSFSAYDNQHKQKFDVQFFNKEIFETKNFTKEAKFNATPMRAFRYGIVDIPQIDTDVRDTSNRYYQTCTDAALMLSLFKKVRYEEVKLIPEILYTYRQNRPNNSINRFGGNNKKDLYKKIIEKTYG